MPLFFFHLNHFQLSLHACCLLTASKFKKQKSPVRIQRNGAFLLMWSHQESNLDLRLRKPTYYPLYYGTEVKLV